MAKFNPVGYRPKVTDGDTTPNPIPTTNVLQKLWVARATVYEYQNVVDPHTHQTTQKLVEVYKDIPCRLSYLTPFSSDLNPADIGEIDQKPTLFCSPALDIKPGSVISVEQLGRTRQFFRSSEPARYTNHQQIRLELNEDV